MLSFVIADFGSAFFQRTKYFRQHAELALKHGSNFKPFCHDSYSSSLFFAATSKASFNC